MCGNYGTLYFDLFESRVLSSNTAHPVRDSDGDGDGDGDENDCGNDGADSSAASILPRFLSGTHLFAFSSYFLLLH
jgi:hypothetical protein